MLSGFGISARIESTSRYRPLLTRPNYLDRKVAYRVWRWAATGLHSLNGESWLPGRPIEGRCRIASAAHDVRGAGCANEIPDRKCTCGVYAANNIDHLRQYGYYERGIHGEVSLWGRLVEHNLGWRAQFAYPKSLFLPLHLVPFTLVELDARLNTLTVFGTDISYFATMKASGCGRTAQATMRRAWTTLSRCARSTTSSSNKNER